MGGSSLPEVRQLRLTRTQLQAMRAHIEACLPEEACGLLPGAGAVVQEVIPIENQVHSTVRFRMHPTEQLRTFERIDAHGWQLLGIFHSHPAGPAHPSPTDIAEASYDVVHVIWSPRGDGWQTNGFWIHNGLVSAVELTVVDTNAAEQ